MSRVVKLTMLGLGALFIAGCSSLPSMGRLGGGGGEDFAAGSALSHRLTGADREALSAAFARAMASGEAQSWRGRRAAGVVAPAGYSLANLFAHPGARIALARPDIDLNQVMETELGLYVLTRNANIRLGPGTNYPVAEMLPSGAGVEAVGGVVDKDWLLIVVDGAVRGYVHRSLVVKAPGTELDLAGGPRRRPVLCREFAQRVSVGGMGDEWTGAACNDGSGWRLAAEPPPPEDDAEDDRLEL